MVWKKRTMRYLGKMETGKGNQRKENLMAQRMPKELGSLSIRERYREFKSLYCRPVAVRPMIGVPPRLTYSVACVIIECF